MQFSCVREQTGRPCRGRSREKEGGHQGGCWTTRRLCLDSSHYGEAVCGTLRRAGTVLGQQVLEQRRWYRYRAQQILAGTYMYSWSERLTRGQIVGAFKASVRWRVNGAEAQPVTCPLLRRRRKSCKSKRGQGCEMSKHPQWPAGPSRRRNGDLHEIRHLFFSFFFFSGCFWDLMSAPFL